MKCVDKAVAIVTRRNARTCEILCFEHPIAGTQLPKGTVESGEEITAAVLRELHEESGLKLNQMPEMFAEMKVEPTSQMSEQIWHFGLLNGDHEVRENWTHRPIGSPEEIGLEFSFFWKSVEDELKNSLCPVFERAFSIACAHLRTGDINV
ncbi:MAG: NUDIX domain-containing protein [Paracoccaceae bacterium]|jgi:8-oxo-dGTP pyrophosphatase MutT (NUDIX family)|nr:NUDIX domain-containing protein [Paracoccaceae bacterium]